MIGPTDGLNDHDIDFIGAELDLITGKTVRQTKDHGIHVCLAQASDQTVPLLPYASQQLFGQRPVKALIIDGI